MTDPLTACQSLLNERNRQQGFMDETESILETLRDRLAQQYEDMDEECGELEDSWDDFGDQLASIIGNLWIPGLIEDAIEIAQCTHALGVWEQTLHEIANFEERLEIERNRRDAAEAAWLKCLHDAMTTHR
ncbi:hypothetical protein [Mycobacterium decipiens]|uniref:hypothetical protein n=1 Tax=Mycobacterium decipiens TaxID=1430326 RepID=UPI0013FD9519|nr:hypothetical protein [Mycobacterium decipiens]